MNRVLITSENRRAFTEVLPPELPEKNRTTIGVCDDGGSILGTVSMQTMEDRCVVDWLYVVPGARRKGAGRGLMDTVVDFNAYAGDLPLSCTFEADEDNGLFEFFISDSMAETLFDVTYLCERFYVRPKEIAKLPKVTGTIKDKFQLFFDLPKSKQYAALSVIADHFEIGDHTAWEKSCLKDICRVLFRNGKLESLILFNDRTDGNIELSYLFGRNPKATVALIYDTIDIGRMLYPGAKIIFDAINEKSETLAMRLFPRSKCVSIYEAER